MGPPDMGMEEDATHAGVVAMELITLEEISEPLCQELSIIQLKSVS